MYLVYILFFLFSSFLYIQTSNVLIQEAETIHQFDQWITTQERTSFQTILKNINPPGTKRGFFAASLSTDRPDYFYTWTRDAALVARVLTSLEQTNDTLLEDYVEFQIDAQSTATQCNCLGEPKFNKDGTGYTGSWGRPQNDGPAERAITFILIAKRWHNSGYRENIDDLVSPILKDLNYINRVWYQSSFDLWEEIDGTHFYTLMVMRRALLDGIDFLKSITNASLEEYKLNAYLIGNRIESFWSSQHNYIMATQNVQNGVRKPSGLDVSTLLAANLVASRNDGFFTPGSDKILATAFALEESFMPLYPINGQQDEHHMGTCIGRYPEDIYDGYGTSVGNPWFLATAAYTELYYLAIEEWKQVGISINEINYRFFRRMIPSLPIGSHYAPDSVTGKKIIGKTKAAADKFLATIQYHAARNGSMSEQYDRYIGFMAGARDLTWSHAAFISATKAKYNTPIQ